MTTHTLHPTKKLCRAINGGVPHCTNVSGNGSPTVLGVMIFVLLLLAPIATRYISPAARPEPRDFTQSSS